MPESAVQQQREAFAALLERLGQASLVEVRQALAERREGPPEPALDAEMVVRMRKRIANALAQGR